MKNQRRADRLARLQEGRCPVHGLTMGQVGLTHEGTVFVVACPRKDCSIKGHSVEPFGSVMLEDEFLHLLEEH